MSDWKSRAKPVSQSTGSWKDRAKKVEPDKNIMEKTAETFYDMKRGVQEGVPGYGLIQKAAAGTNALIEEGLEQLGADYVGEKDLSQRYKDQLSADMARDKAANERSPIANLTGNVLGSFFTPSPIKGGIAGRIATNAGVAAADQATRSDELLDLERGKDAGVLAGSISAGVEALPYVGKIGSAIRRAAPAQADSYKWSNKVASELAGLNPLSKATADEVGELYSDVANRRTARGLNLNEETVRVSEQLQGADESLRNAIGKRYDELQKDSLTTNIRLNDTEAVWNFMDGLRETNELIASRPKDFEKNTLKILDRIESIIENGAIDEAKRGITGAGTKLSEIVGDPELYFGLFRYRLLDARRALDDVTKNKDWDRLFKNDRDVILGVRDSINQRLQQEFTGARQLNEADKLWSESTKLLTDTFDRVKTGDSIDPTKLKSNLNPELTRGIKFTDQKDKLKKFIENNEATLGEIPEMKTALAELENLQNLVKQKSQMDIAERAAGGPTGQGANNILQFFAATSTGGMSLLLLPVTNPAMYTRLIDGLAEAVGKVEANRFAQAVRQANQAALQKAPDVVTRAYAISQEKEDDK